MTREAARLGAAVVRERLTTGLVFNPVLGRNLRNPYPLYRQFRERDPIHRSHAVRGWVLFRHADALAMLRDTRFSADDRNYLGYAQERAGAIADGVVDPSRPDEPVMLRRDPPDHTRLRSLVNKAFTPRAIDKLQGRIESLTAELLDQIQQRGEADVIADFAIPLPVTIIAEMLGVPSEDRAIFKRWSDHLVGFLDPQASPGPEILRRTAEEFFAYMGKIAAARRSEPADDLMSALVTAEERGQKLSEQELNGTLALLLAAGNETTTNLIGNGLLALLRHPEQLARLRSDPTLIDSAVEELLRWDSPVQFTMRIPLEDLDFNDHHFERGQAIVAVLGAANRDPAANAEPEHLDIGRAEVRHLSFGHGVHFCLGAQLARLEGKIALGMMIQRLPQLRLAENNVRWRRLTFLRGVERLPIRV